MIHIHLYVTYIKFISKDLTCHRMQLNMRNILEIYCFSRRKNSVIMYVFQIINADLRLAINLHLNAETRYVHVIREMIIKRNALVDLRFCDDLISLEKFKAPYWILLCTRVEMRIFHKSCKFSLRYLTLNNTGNFERNYCERYIPIGYDRISLQQLAVIYWFSLINIVNMYTLYISQCNI